MKKILFIVMLLVMTQAAWGVRIALVVEDPAAPGTDSLLYNDLVNNLGYTVTYFDIDNMTAGGATYNSAYFKTNFDGFVLCGANATLPSPTTNGDTITNAYIGGVALGPDWWDEMNIGTQDATDERSSEGTGYLLNLGQPYWPTRVYPDTIQCFAATSKIFYNLLFPDTCHAVVPLIIDKDYKSDTSRVVMCMADSGVQIVNTGDGRNISHGRRIYLGIWQSLTTAADSCQFWSLFERSVAWVTKDTIGNALKRICFSGKYETEWCTVVESNGATSSYGNYDANIGYDHNEKHAFMKVKNSAMQRKVGSVYRALDVNRAYWSLYYGGNAFSEYGGSNPTVWAMGFSLRPIIVKWQIERKNCFYSATCPNACFSYAWKDTAAEPDVDHAWTGQGATSTSDSRAIDYDTMEVDQATTANTWQVLDVQPDTLGGRMLDTLLNFGWATRLMHHSNNLSGPEDGEMKFFAPTDNNLRSPRLNITLSTFSTTIPTPHIVVDCGTYGDDSLVFSGVLGEDLGAKTVQLTNSQGGALNCATIVDDQSWLATFSSGADMPITVTHGITSQTLGYRSATVTITCADADNSPITYKVICIFTAASAATPGGTVKIK